jgi:hypothetical protein
MSTICVITVLLLIFYLLCACGLDLHDMTVRQTDVYNSRYTDAVPEPDGNRKEE